MRGKECSSEEIPFEARRNLVRYGNWKNAGMPEADNTGRRV